MSPNDNPEDLINDERTITNEISRRSCLIVKSPAIAKKDNTNRETITCGNSQIIFNIVSITDIILDIFLPKK